VLLGQLPPTQGTLKLGTHLEVAYFDQIREQIDLNLSLLDNVAGGRTFITFGGQNMHAYSYLQQFLFTPERARTPASALSGGEKNRLLLAKLLSLPNNVLVMDEPTNDLDLETLDVLEALLVSYPGTLILISHDRTFLDNVVTSTIAFDSDGVPREYVGGYEDWLQQRPKIAQPMTRSESKPKTSNTSHLPAGLTAQEKKRQAALPAEIESLEKKIGILTSVMAEPSFYAGPPEIMRDKQQDMKNLQQQLTALYTEWEQLER
jgi:ATP-binding cassette subfamily F protein uup